MDNNEKEKYLDKLINDAITKNNKYISFPISSFYKYRKANEDNINAFENDKAWFSNEWEDKTDLSVSFSLEEEANYLYNNFNYFVKTLAEEFAERFFGERKFEYNFHLSQSKINYMININDDLDISDILRMSNYSIDSELAKDLKKRFNSFLKIIKSKEMEDKFNSFIKINNIRYDYLFYCLTEEYDNGSLWDNYADGGNGFCIGYKFNISKKEDKEILKNMIPILYNKKDNYYISELVKGIVNEYLAGNDIKEYINNEVIFLLKNLFTKDINYNNEKEWKVIQKKQDEKNGCLLDFNFAVEIYLGDKLSEEYKERLIRIAKKKNIKIYERKLNITKSKYLYDEIIY